MEKIILTEIPIAFDTETIAAMAHIREESDMYDDLEESIPMAKRLSKPKAIIKPFTLEEVGEDTLTIDGVKITSKKVCDLLRGHDKVYLGVVSAGDEVSASGETEYDLVSYYLESFALKEACDFVRNHLKDEFGFANEYIEPGCLDDFSMENNKILFDLIGTVAEDIGVTLRDTYFMRPIVTLSAIFYPASEA